jgi:hypothetical protein
MSGQLARMNDQLAALLRRNAALDAQNKAIADFLAYAWPEIRQLERRLDGMARMAQLVAYAPAERADGSRYDAATGAHLARTQRGLGLDDRARLAAAVRRRAGIER